VECSERRTKVMDWGGVSVVEMEMSEGSWKVVNGFGEIW
jgi:hypothetical protein